MVSGKCLYAATNTYLIRLGVMDKGACTLAR